MDKSRAEYMRDYRQKKREIKLKTVKLEPKKMARNSTQRSRDYRARLEQISKAEPTAAWPNLVVSNGTIQLSSLPCPPTPSTSTTSACQTGHAEIRPRPAYRRVARHDDDEEDFAEDSMSPNKLAKIKERTEAHNKIGCQGYLEIVKIEPDETVDSEIYNEPTSIADEEEIKLRKEYDKQKSQHYGDKKIAANFIKLETDQSSKTVVKSAVTRHTEQCGAPLRAVRGRSLLLRTETLFVKNLVMPGQNVPVEGALKEGYPGLCTNMYLIPDTDPSAMPSPSTEPMAEANPVKHELYKTPKTAERGRGSNARKSLLKQQSKRPLEPDVIVEIATEDIGSAGPSSSEDNIVPGPSEIRKMDKRARSAEATRRWRAKKRGQYLKKQAKSAAQRMREYRQRKKKLGEPEINVEPVAPGENEPDPIQIKHEPPESDEFTVEEGFEESKEESKELVETFKYEVPILHSCTLDELYRAGQLDR